MFLGIPQKSREWNSLLKTFLLDFSGGIVDKNPPANAGDTASIPGLGKIPQTMGQLSSCTTISEPVCLDYY